MRWVADNVPAILDIWYPGSQGGAVRGQPAVRHRHIAGRRPFTWPRTVGQVPLNYSHTRSTVTVSVKINNSSDREGTEVVQLYLHQRYGSAARPVRELKGFQRVTVPAPGAPGSVHARP
jgi:beta-glucosidase